MRVPASLVAVPLLIGSVIGLVVADHAYAHLALCAAGGAALALLAGLAWLDESCPPETLFAVIAGSLLAGLSLGLSAARAAYAPPLLAWFDALDASRRDGTSIVEGVLREDAFVTPAGASLTIDVRAPARGGLRATVAGSAFAGRIETWRRGRTIRVPVLLRRPSVFHDPGVADDSRVLARRGVALVGSIKSATLVEVLARGSPLSEGAASARAFTRAALDRHVGQWSPRSAGLATAVLIGDRSGLSNDDERRLQEAGTYHVVAISGGNIAILTALLLGLVRVTGVPARLGSVVAMPLLVAYGQLAGASASVERAVAAAVIYLSARVLDHRGSPLNALAVAALWAIAASPLDALDAGFVLSFGATLGILLGAGYLPRARPRSPAGLRAGLRRVLLPAAALVVATACAEAALVPVSATVFSRITFAGLVLNLAAIPLVTIVQVASMATLAAAILSGALAGICGFAAHLAAAGIVGSAHVVEMMPWLSCDVSPPSWWLCGSYYVSYAVALVHRRSRRVGLAGVVLSTSAMLCSAAATSRDTVPPAPAGWLRVVFLDVGQGDATLVRLPDGRDLLVDAGGLPGSTFDVGERVVVPAARAFGTRRLDTLVLTHGDPDHVGGAMAILRRLDPRTVWEGIPVPPHEGLRALSLLAASRRATWRSVQAGDVERLSDAVVRVLHPAPADWERQRVRNDDSIVLEVRLGDVSVLLPGDIGQEPERALARHLSLARTVILKAPHHGSATSSSAELLAAARPSAVVFSAGPGNRFGHPAPVVVSRYVDRGALVFRTDLDGAVILDTDGKRVTIRTWTGRWMQFGELSHETRESTTTTK